jgi:hypothetical protein
VVARPVVPMMAGSAAATTSFSAPLSLLLFGFFFGFDFFAEFFVFGVFGCAAFAFVIDLFDHDGNVFAVVCFTRFVFAVVRFPFVVVRGNQRRRRGGRREAYGVGGGRRREQQQRGEQQDQQDREFPHATCIGAFRRTP